MFLPCGVVAWNLGPAPLELIGECLFMAKIYVGNLPFSAGEADIRTLFSQHGTVESVSLPTDRETGRPRGFGFVEMSQGDAAKAIQSLNGYNMGGRPLRVNEAQDKPRTGGGRPGGGGGGGGYRGGGGGGGGGGGDRW
jgi:cold-inducible RNA-binding protein